MTLDERIEALVMTSELHSASIHALENTARELRIASQAQRDSINMLASVADRVLGKVGVLESRIEKLEGQA